MKILFEYPLTLFFSLILIFSYISILSFLSDETIRHYFLSYPGKFNLNNWILSTFAHASIGHLISNVIFLFILGRAVEEKLGKMKWLLVYFMAAFISSFVDSFVRGFIFTEDRSPSLGASGAISGLAAVAALLSPYIVRVNGMNFPFPIFLIAWVSLYSDFMRLFASDKIAHWAHLSGFFSVFITMYFLNEKDREKFRDGFILNAVFFVLTLILVFLVQNR